MTKKLVITAGRLNNVIVTRFHFPLQFAADILAGLRAKTQVQIVPFFVFFFFHIEILNCNFFESNTNIHIRHSAMEKQGQPRFFTTHSSSVRAVAFSPNDRHIFCSAGNDGNVCMYHAGRAELLNIYPVINTGLNRHVNAARFTCDGKKILTITTSRRLSVLDAERGIVINSYENCAFSGRERAALATNPLSAHNAVSSYVNGKGITLFDLRMPLPMDFIFDLHDEPIRDIHYLDSSWPFSKTQTLITIGANGATKLTTVDGRLLYSFNFNHPANSIVSTPEIFGSAADDGFASALVAGGTILSSYAPAPKSVREIREQKDHHQQQQNNLVQSISLSRMDHDGIDADGEDSSPDDDGDDEEDEIVINHQPPPPQQAQPPTQRSFPTSRSDVILRIRAVTGGSSGSSGFGAARRNNGTFSSNNNRSSINDFSTNDANNNYNNNNISNGSPSSSSSTLSSTIRHQVMSHIENHNLNHPHVNPQRQNASASASAIPRSITISSSHALTSSVLRNANLHHFLAMNFLPIRQQPSSTLPSSSSATTGSSARIVGSSTSSPLPSSSSLSSSSSSAATATAATLSDEYIIPLDGHVSPSQIFFHDRWNSSPILMLQQQQQQSFTTAFGRNCYDFGGNNLPQLLQRPTTVEQYHRAFEFTNRNNNNKPEDANAPNIASRSTQQIWRLRYSTNGALLYAGGDGGSVKRYRQYPQQQIRFLDEVLRHRGDVLDLDLSPFDEYLVTASKDKTVGLICLGSPNHGFTECYQLT